RRGRSRLLRSSERDLRGQGLRRRPDCGIRGLEGAVCMTDLVPAPPPSPPARRDDTVLPGTAERIRKGVSANTAKAYTEVRKQFEDWCVDHGRLPYPTSAATLA